MRRGLGARRPVQRRSGRWVGWLLVILTTLAAAAASPKRVLILNPFGRDVAPYNAAIAAFRATLAQEVGGPVDFYELPLDLARFSEAEGEGPLVAFVEGRIQSQPVDLVVPVGGAGAQFAARHHERLFPRTPILLLASAPQLVSPDLLRAQATLVTQKVNLRGMVEDILQLKPQTTNIVVVLGASALEQYWVRECRREFQVFTNQVGFTWLNQLSLEQILERCAALPPRSFILHGLFVVDAVGMPCEKNLALRRLHEVANAPLFSYFASEFGLGPIGGRLFRDSEIGTQAAHTAVRILRGERPEQLVPQLFEAGLPVFDWRELQRWNVREARLPAGSLIRFRQPSVWERYRWPVTGTVLFGLLQAALLVGLFFQWSKRRQGEAEATLVADISSNFVNLRPDEVDREILDAERQLGEFLHLDLLAVWQWLDGDPGALTLTHCYNAREDLPTGREFSEAGFPWFRQQMLAGRTLAIASLEDLPAEADRDRESCRQLGIRSSLCLPLSIGGEVPLGILGLSTTRATREWPDALIMRLRLVAQIFANALARRRADQALQESEERLTLAAEAAEFGVWVWSLARNEVWGSKRWMDLFGFASGEGVSFEAILRRVHPDDRQSLERAVRRALAERSDYAGEFRAVLPDGTERWIASQGRVHVEADGAPGRMLGAAVDITERRRSAAALQHLGRRLIRAQEEERSRLARELHDDITQRLARLAIDAGRVERVPDELPRAEILRTLREGLVRLSEDIHALSYRLHPSVLEDLGLAEALNAECERFSRQESIPADVTLQELPAVVPPETALCLFRVTQEALRNVARHAQARRVEVSVRAQEGGLRLAVTDDGVGFDPGSQRDRPSLGLASMRERVLLLDGELDIESTPGEGTTILVWVPLAKPESLRR